VNRPQLQRLSQLRLDDAQALLAASRWSAAYYLAGYAVECALKSCVLKHIDTTGEIFASADYLKDLSKYWTHDFTQLLKLAGLPATHGTALRANPALLAFWTMVKDWSEASRYQEKTEVEAKALYEAITNNPDGVFEWIRQHW
jgi:HEPN domain-containing protein